MFPQVSRGSEAELDEEVDLAAASDTDVGDCGLEERESSTDMVRRLLVKVRMVSVATVVAEEVDITAGCQQLRGHIGAIATAAAAARLRWGRCARSCRYSRYYSNNVGLPSDSDDLTHGGR